MNYLRTLLDDAASAPAPPAEIDVELAMRSGTRIVRRRRLAWMAGAASAVVACLIASALVFTPAAQEPAVPMPQPELGKVFEPDKKYASFGRLPGQFTQSAVETGPDWHRQWGTNGSWQVELRMVTAGRDIELSGLDEGFAVDPAQVDQRWLDRSDPPDGREMAWNAVRVQARDFAVRWQYAPAAWIEVAVQNADNPKETLMDIVNGLRVGPEEASLPIRLTGTPSRPTGFSLTENGNWWTASLSYQGDVHVTVDSVGAAPDSTFDTEIDGKRARIQPKSVAVFEPSGARAYIYRPDGDPVELYRMLRIDR